MSVILHGSLVIPCTVDRFDRPSICHPERDCGPCRRSASECFSEVDAYSQQTLPLATTDVSSTRNIYWASCRRCSHFSMDCDLRLYPTTIVTQRQPPIFTDCSGTSTDLISSVPSGILPPLIQALAIDQLHCVLEMEHLLATVAAWAAGVGVDDLDLVASLLADPTTCSDGVHSRESGNVVQAPDLAPSALPAGNSTSAGRHSQASDLHHQLRNIEISSSSIEGAAAQDATGRVQVALSLFDEISARASTIKPRRLVEDIHVSYRALLLSSRVRIGISELGQKRQLGLFAVTLKCPVQCDIEHSPNESRTCVATSIHLELPGIETDASEALPTSAFATTTTATTKSSMIASNSRQKTPCPMLRQRPAGLEASHKMLLSHLGVRDFSLSTSFRSSAAALAVLIGPGRFLNHAESEQVISVEHPYAVDACHMLVSMVLKSSAENTLKDGDELFWDYGTSFHGVTDWAG